MTNEPKAMDRATKMTEVPARQLAGIILMIGRIGKSAVTGKCEALLAETGTDTPTYGNIQMLARRVDTFNLALSNAGIKLPATKTEEMRLALLLVGPETPVCKKCGDLGIDIEGGDEPILAEAGQACPACMGYLEGSGSRSPYPAWTTLETVPPTTTVDVKTVRGARIPIDEEAIRSEFRVDAGLDALLKSEGVLAREFLLWLFHGPEKRRFAGDPRGALDVLENPLAAARNENVLRNWVKDAKAFRIPQAEPASASTQAEPPTRRFAPGAREKLALLLSNLFSSSEVRRLVLNYTTDGEEICRALPEPPCSMRSLVDAVADEWIARGLVNDDLFAELIVARGGRRKDIEEVAMMFKPQPTDAEIYNALCRLMSSQFTTILYFSGAAPGTFSGDSAPQSTRATELVQWIKQDPGRRERIIADIRKAGSALL